ncbi:MAG: amidohydrolase family protein [Oscillospiraceae bacterium]|jgi:guanine deaminase|nr:amidohydrolase family protein [Oscillospiraceae bacterium]
MANFVLKGNICYSENLNKIRIIPQAYLVCIEGESAGVFRAVPECYAALPVEDFGESIIIPGITDLHVHAPQFAFRGLGMDMELLDWLESHTFPEESKYADLGYAKRAYKQFVNHMRRSATTRAAVFATIHAPATMLLMDRLEESGLVSYVGKVNMDRNSPDILCEKSAQASLADTEQWINDTKTRYKNTRPIITPRFIPSCSDELMHGLAALAEKYQVPVQSHLSENLGEIQWVKALCPKAKFYGQAYENFGMFGGKSPCIMAHCVYSGDEEVELMKKNGVFVAHSPMSNSNLSSGVAPVTKYLEAGLNVGLASDVAGGCTENMFRVMADAIRASKLRWRLQDQAVKPLTIDQIFYIATLGGGRFFGKVGSFEPGYALDAVVLDDRSLDHPQRLDVRARLERCIYLADDRQISAKYVAGNRLF